jgi:hypothetical protein
MADPADEVDPPVGPERADVHDTGKRRALRNKAIERGPMSRSLGIIDVYT